MHQLKVVLFRGATKQQDVVIMGIQHVTKMNLCVNSLTNCNGDDANQLLLDVIFLV